MVCEVYFPVIRWISLRYALDDIDEAVHFLEHNIYASLLKHLGGNVYVRSESPSLYVEFWYNDSVPEGITIDQHERVPDMVQQQTRGAHVGSHRKPEREYF